MSVCGDIVQEPHRISVRERDLDNFLLEELRASGEFRLWFLGRMAHCLDVPDHAGVAVGKNPRREVTAGQTDLSLALLDAEGRSVIHVLIESKVGAGFEPDQPERYAEEVAAARQRLGHRRAAAALVAPRANTAVLDNPNFDASVRLEEIINFLGRRRERLLQLSEDAAIELAERLAARMDLLDALINKHSYNGSWTPNPVPERLDFMTQYRTLAKRLAPKFQTTDSTGGPEAQTMLFKVPPVSGLAVANIRHDFPGRVSLVLRKSALAEGALVISGLLPPGASTSTTKAGSLLVTLSAPTLVPSGDRFTEQQPKVEAGIHAAVTLHEWAMTNSTPLAALLSGIRE